ncbi:UDP-N-acetyl-D-mannosamine dehydrogenase [Caulobacter sp. 17J80-11]|uniref:UDP-N-acetyl-D-mannosamine dehydrogenase n=1 Tax=Caulobacter sp. 17J80-11 TaxID=2763502 RepID=UPI001653E7EA|nr:UDP-N-acetyl-D-mannosamine dehydrogenase [Caulobacter sp. 17J80-11]MBC6981695.1 UDP-N-acetyl-D-mannosamine dehydrogenase [Caulobacter sp. 17J80-11]
MPTLSVVDAAPNPRGRVGVVGLGYIGLPTAACLAGAGFEVIGIDVDPRVIEAVNAGRAHIVEPGLDELLSAVVDGGRLRAVLAPEPADIWLIAVPTPVGHDQFRTPDLSYVDAAADALAPVLKRGDLVVLESTSPVGTTRRMIERLSAARPDLRFPQDGRPEAEVDVDAAYSPERVIPGRTLEELAINDRVVGGATPRAARRAAALYRHMTSGELLQTDDRTAEFVKLAENAFRDVNIAFANELSMVCDQVGLNVWEVIRLANHHPRVSVLTPGPGVGGHCIAVDPWFIVAQAPEAARLIRTAREVNDGKPDFVLAKIGAVLEADPQAVVACLGLAFKPNVDDFRESPSLDIARALTARYPGRVICAEPYADALRDPGELVLKPLPEALETANAVLALVAHDEFRALPRPRVPVVDACGLWK